MSAAERFSALSGVDSQSIGATREEKRAAAPDTSERAVRNAPKPLRVVDCTPITDCFDGAATVFQQHAGYLSSTCLRLA
jgi:hypothetical protein